METNSSKKAIVHLPGHQVQARDAASLRIAVEAASPLASNYGGSIEKTGGFGDTGAQFAVPRIFDPARQKRIGQRGYGYNNYMDIDHNEEARKNLLDGVEVIMKTNPVMRACHPAGTLVDVEGRLVPIEDVSVGDKVKTHKGRYRKVEETMAFRYEGNMYSFGTTYGNGEIKCTSDHNLYVFNRLSERYCWTAACDVKIGNYLVMPVRRGTNDLDKIIEMYGEPAGHCFLNGDYLHVEVNCIKPSKFDGTVYNLEVKGDHSYTANGFASHNCLEVYARYPTAGAHLECKNKDVNDFFEQIFFEDLDYENFLIDVGREYWQYGEVFANGVWDDSLGIWTEEELLDPRQMEIIRVPFSSENLLKFVPDEEMKRIVMGNDVAGRIFCEENPEFAELVKTGQDIIISPDRCVHLANKDSVRDMHGTPVALRAWNTLRLEERLQSAMLATADRMYAPLLLFSLGGNLADGSPYIPSPNAISTFRSRLDAALSSDFRALITNQFVNVQEVIRGDKMANFKNDIDMYDDRLFMAWGLSSSILKPSSGPYATSAMEFELASQMLRSYQKCLCELYNRRAAFVAEANEIYDYDIIGGVKVDKTEWREVWDEDANDGEGGFVVKEVPKLLFPELRMECVPPDAQVLTPRGYVCAGDLDVGDDVVSYDDGNNKFVCDSVIANERGFSDDMYRITTNEGRVVECTYNHPFFTENGWIHADHITPSMKILKARNANVERVMVNAGDEDAYEMVANDEMRLLGVIANYGTLTADKRININGLCGDAISKFLDLCHNVFGFDAARVRKNGKSTFIQISNAEYYKRVSSIFGNFECFPNEVALSEKVDKLAFLDGYFIKNGDAVFPTAKTSGFFSGLLSVMREVHFSSNKVVSLDDTAYILGLLVGDGSCGIPYVSLTGIDDCHIELFKRIALSVGCNVCEVDAGKAVTLSVRRSMSRSGGAYLNPFVKLLKSVGLHGSRCASKRVPGYLFESSNNEKTAFLSGYLDTDGAVVPSGKKVIWHSSNRGILLDCQALLESVGVSSKLSMPIVRETSFSKLSIMFNLTVRGERSLGILRSILSPLVGYKASGLQECVPAYSMVEDSIYDIVVNVERVSSSEIVRLGINSTHTYIVEGLVTHNTINFNTTEKTRDFLMQLQKQGIPVARQAFFMGTDIDYRATAEQASQDAIHDAVQEAEEHAAIFRACTEKGIPVPPATAKYLKEGILSLEQQQLLEKIMPEDEKKDSPFEKSPEEEAVSQLETMTDLEENAGEYGDGARPDVSDERREDMEQPGSYAHVEARNAMNRIGSTRGCCAANNRAKSRREFVASLMYENPDIPLAEPSEVDGDGE